MVSEKQYNNYLKSRVKKNNIILDEMDNGTIQASSIPEEQYKLPETGYYKVKQERKSFLTANIESNLHRQITQEAARNGVSFSAQIQEWYSRLLDTQEKLDDAREEIRKITDVN